MIGMDTSHAVVRLATESDIAALERLDPWPKRHQWEQKIHCQEVVVLESESQLIGLIRYVVLWSTVPFMEMIIVEAAHRGRGHSQRLLAFLTDHLRQQGFVALLSSSQTDEPTPQAWHKHMGFRSNGIIENIADDDVGEIVYRLML